MRKLGLALALPCAAVLLLAAFPATAAENLGTSHGVRYVRSTVTLPASSGPATTAEARPKCPTGWKAISGGATIEPGANRAISTTTKGGKRYWYVNAWQTTNAPTELGVYSVCMQTTGLDFETNSAFGLTSGPHSGTASCSSGHAVGGGLRAIGDAEDYSWNASRPNDEGDADTVPDDSWTTWFEYTGSGGGVLYDVICLGGPRPTYVSNAASVAGNSSGGVNAKCPAGTTVIGGTAFVDGTPDQAHVIGSRPWDSADSGHVPDDGWRAAISATTSSGRNVTAWAICR
jgi:hypothetical protein